MKAPSFLLLLTLIIEGCNSQPNPMIHGPRKDEPIDTNNKIYQTLKLRKTIGELLKNDQPNKAEHVIDSLILKNRNNGVLYFEKGMINVYSMNFKMALLNFSKADSLKYDKEECQKMILFCQKFMHNDRDKHL
jgi:hypothetical protein